MKFIFLFLFSISSQAFTLSTFQKGWNTKTLSINLNPTNCPSDISERLEDSFKLWNSVPTSSLKLSMGNQASATTTAELNAGTATDVPVVICDTQFSSTVSVDGNSVAGVGFATGTDIKGHISYGGLVLNVQAGMGASLTSMTTTQKNIVIAHEIGHMLGLGHSSSNPALMYYSIGGKEDFNLSKDDWDGLSYLYPRDELGQTNLAAGCGLVKNSSGSGSGPSAALFLLLIPFLYYFQLRYKSIFPKFFFSFFLFH